MTETQNVVAPPARMTLFGFKAVPARAEVVHRPRPVRVSRALLYLAGCWALMPIVAIIPPHFPWAIAAFGAGIYLAWTNWRGTYEVRSVEATCPSCGGALTVKAGAKISLPHKIVCYACHQEPFLELADAPE
ncbi:MAG TPA: hypothetical protein VF212_17470 [Longimicrobiales bacterium]